ncbi:TPA: hypothetical protein R1W87_003958 [Pseudomonas aeruginosa]|nr:hypothetical protein [Pseudomonas aeruginosa]HEC1420445.1 hypothetical protein [Pseudomonas aeruginosa]
MAERMTVEAWVERYRTVAAASGLGEADPPSQAGVESLVRLQVTPEYAVAFLLDLEREFLYGSGAADPRPGGLLGRR